MWPEPPPPTLATPIGQEGEGAQANARPAGRGDAASSAPATGSGSAPARSARSGDGTPGAAKGASGAENGPEDGAVRVDDR